MTLELIAYISLGLITLIVLFRTFIYLKKLWIARKRKNAGKYYEEKVAKYFEEKGYVVDRRGLRL